MSTCVWNEYCFMETHALRFIICAGYQRYNGADVQNARTINELLLFHAKIRISKVNYSRILFFRNTCLQCYSFRAVRHVKDKLMHKTCLYGSLRLSVTTVFDKRCRQ
jgi:hypothetical protein